MKLPVKSVSRVPIKQALLPVDLDAGTVTAADHQSVFDFAGRI
jgi:hypothetical protein